MAVEDDEPVLLQSLECQDKGLLLASYGLSPVVSCCPRATVKDASYGFKTLWIFVEDNSISKSGPIITTARYFFIEMVSPSVVPCIQEWYDNKRPEDKHILMNVACLSGGNLS